MPRSISRRRPRRDLTAQPRPKAPAASRMLNRGVNRNRASARDRPTLLAIGSRAPQSKVERRPPGAGFFVVSIATGQARGTGLHGRRAG